MVFWEHRFELIQDVDAITNCITQLFSCCHTKRDKRPILTQDETKDVSTVAASHEWFRRIVHFKKSSKIPNPIRNVFIFGVMAIWVLVGLCTLGMIWPRHARRKIFAPSVMDHLTEDESELEMEMEKMKGENRMLEERNSIVNEENEKLKKMLDALQSKLP